MSGPAAHNQPLPSKEAALFKQVVKLYEDKQHKKAIKAADQILKKFPDHGETLSMKGLTISNMGPEKKEEAYDLVRRGLKADLRSHVCWHVYGLLYRADRDYKEAIKCYLNALRLDPENLQILRDLAGLQIQMRDLQGFAETRQKLLALKPSQRNNWVTFALAQHACKQYDVAVQVLDAYEGSLTELPPGEAYEHSELLLYKAQVLDEGGRLGDALALLDSHQDKLKDKLGMLEHRASLLLRLGRTDDAAAQYRGLLDTNPDHYRWHEGLQAALGLRPVPDAARGTPSLSLAALEKTLTPEQRNGLAALYAELAVAYPRSSACRRIPLDFLEGDAFVNAADSYVRRYLLKGIPSLFMDLRPLYRNPEKVAALQRLFEGYAASLAATGQLPPLASPPAAANGTAALDSPQTHVWVLYYLAQHHDQLGDHTRGLELLAEAEAHTPTLIELHTSKSKLLRHAGDLLGAAHAAETARRQDLSDRYLNSAAFKALMKADKVEAADKTAALFVKEGEGAAGLAALYDMQHMGYEVAAGRAYARRRQHGKALKKFTAILKHFDDIHEDQFDFHSYCVRKTTLRAYVAMLAWEDSVFSQPYYRAAAAGAIRTYLAIADEPSAAQQEADEEAMLAAMTPEERKKYKLKKKKEEKKAAAAKAADAAGPAPAPAAAAGGGAGGGKDAKDKKKGAAAAVERPKDPDPDGAKLAACEDPVGEAAKLVVSLKQHVRDGLETHLLATEVYVRRGRLLLALSGARNAVRLAGAEHPEAHRALLRVVCAAETATQAANQPSPHPTVAALLAEGIAGLLGGAADIRAYHNAWVAAHGTRSLPHRIAGAEGLLRLEGHSAKAAATQLLLGAATQGPQAGAPGSHAECVEAEALLAGPSISDAGAAGTWRAACKAAFPYSRHFGGARVVPLEADYDFDGMTEAFGRLSFV